jgi:hypothetical protein
MPDRQNLANWLMAYIMAYIVAYGSVVTFGSVTFGSVTFGSVTFGSVTFGSVTFGSVTFGSVTFGSVTFGGVTFGSPFTDAHYQQSAGSIGSISAVDCWFVTIVSLTEMDGMPDHQK